MPRNVTVTFDDGSTHLYQGVPDEVTPDQVEQRASGEFGGRKVTSLAGEAANAPSIQSSGLSRESMFKAKLLHPAYQKLGFNGTPEDLARQMEADKASAQEYSPVFGSLRDIAAGATAGPAALADIAGLATPLGVVRQAQFAYDKLRSPTTSELVTGKQVTPLMPLSGYAQQFDQAMANPRNTPQTGPQRIMSAVTRGASGAAATAGLGAVVGGPASFLAANPGMQVLSGASSGLASGSVKEAGGGPISQVVAGLIGGMAPSLISIEAQALSRNNPVGSFTQSGRETAAGNVLNESASNPQAAQTNMASASQIVPGSEPTAAETAKDYGISRLQKTVQNANGTEFADRYSEQNTARNALLNKVAGGATPDATLQRLIDNRDTATAALRDKALNAAPKVNTDAILNKLDTMLADPNNAGAGTQKVLQSARSQIEGKTNAIALYAVRKDIGKALQVGFDSNQAPVVYATGQLRDVQKAIDGAISDVSPTWTDYLSKYSELSKPIDRLGKIIEARGKSNLAVPDSTTGQEILSQAKFKNQVANLADAKLTQGQNKVLDTVLADLNRSAGRNDPNMRAMGSDTAANQQALNEFSLLIKKSLSTKIPFFGKFADWLSTVNESQVQSLVKQGLLNPKQGAQLMQKASQVAAARAALPSLQSQLQSGAVGAVAGTGASQ